VLEFSIGEKLNLIPLFSKARLKQEVGFYYRIPGETIEVSHMDDREALLKRIAKPPFRKASLERHLSSLETSLGPSPGTSILTFRSSAGRLAMARTNPPPHTFPLLSRSLRRF
jgi:hypothetical protein